MAMVPDLLGGPRERGELHSPRSHLLLGLALGWAILVALLLGLVELVVAEALVSAVAVALGSHLLIEAMLGGYPLPLLHRGSLPAPWTEVALNALSLGVLVVLVALAPA